jgi:Predicted 3'-5' exonuclease related to the exonuclease domain of PolB
MSSIAFDIETGPLSKEEILLAVPNWGDRPFDEGALDARAGYVAAIGTQLDAGPIVIGINATLLPGSPGDWATLGGQDILLHPGEKALLDWFWKQCESEAGWPHRIIGFNSNRFDLPFLIRRSWKHRVAIPKALRKGKYWGDCVFDLREIWGLGDYRAQGSLDTVARHLGVGEKNGNGAHFAELLKTEPQAAIGYLRNDIRMTAGVAGVLL